MEKAIHASIKSKNKTKMPIFTPPDIKLLAIPDNVIR